MSNRSLNVGIIGGGIGGLTLAILMRNSGHEVKVFERSKSISAYGAGVQLSPNGVKVLRQLGVENQISKLSSRPEKVSIKNALTNKLLAEIPLGVIACDRYQANFFHIHRADLIQILFSKAIERGVHFHFNTEAIAKFTDQNETVVCVNNQERKFDVVIAADGAHSATRRRFFKNSIPQFLNQVAYRATIPLDKVQGQLRKPEVTILVGAGCHAVLYPLYSRSLLNLVFCRDETDWKSTRWSTSADILELSKSFYNFPGIDCLLSEIGELNKWGLFGYGNILPWNYGRLGLLGDASHPMLPYLAQGANQALEDAWSLGYFLSQGDNLDVAKALDAYGKNRSDRVLKVQKAAARNALLYHLPNGPIKFASHASLRVVSKVMPKLLLTQLDWLYGYNFPN